MANFIKPSPFSAKPLLHRIGKCLIFGCDESQTLRAAALIRRIVNEETRIVSKLGGYMRPDEVGVVRHKITADTGGAGPFKTLAVAAAHQALALELTKETLERATEKAFGHPAGGGLRARLFASSFSPNPNAATSPDVVTAFQSFRFGRRMLHQGETQNTAEIWTYIVSHVTGLQVGVFRCCFEKDSIPDRVKSALHSMNQRPRSSEGADEIRAGVRALEKETWDRTDAKEDFGGTQ